MNRQNFYIGLLVVILLSILAFGTILIKKVDNGSAIETCEVQKRGLRASGHLLSIVKDIETIVTPFPGEKTQPNLPPEFNEAILNLREEAGAYVTIQREQPQHRQC